MLKSNGSSNKEKEKRNNNISLTPKEKCEILLNYVNEIDTNASLIGAANTIVNNNGYLKAYNTDWMGVYNYLSLLNKPEQLYILGNGGFGKAVEYACIHYTLERAEAIVYNLLQPSCFIPFLEVFQKRMPDILQRLDVIKAQFSTSQEGLSELKNALKAEINALIEDLTKVSKELKGDISQISLKHKDSLSESIKRTKNNAVEAWNKARDN